MRNLVRLWAAVAPARGICAHLAKSVCPLLLILAASAGAAHAQSFSLPMHRDVGANPNTAAVGDFNGDGKLDVAVGNTLGNSVTIALGNGDGTFVSSIEYNTDLNPEGVAVADFNKDGKLDVAVANFYGGPLTNGNISVLFGNGDGTAQAAVNYNAPGSPTRLVAADLNSDGNLDLVTASNATDKATVLLGNANGTFNAAVGYAVGTHPQDVAVADFNKDGKLDLATPNTDGGSLSLLLGNGDGTFQAATNLPLSFPLNRPYSIAAGDLNADGNPDLVFPSPASAVCVVLGNGNGAFQSAVGYATTTGEATNARLGDFNGDGKLDVVVINAQSSGAIPSIGVLRGNGDGTLQAVVNFPTQNSPWGLVVTDFNNDGKLDVLTTNNSIGRINVLLNSPSARGADFSATATLPANGVQVASLIDYDTTKTAASFTANINWGDGAAASAGTVTANGSGGFNVTGSHTYALPGLYTLSVKIADTAGNFATASPRATVLKKEQTITFGSLSDKTFGNADFPVSATASSGFAVSFAASGQCTVNGANVHITGAGSCTVTASQAGDAVYSAAPDVPQTFQIAKASTTTAVSTSASPSAFGQSVTFTATVTSAAGTPTGAVQFKIDGTNAGAPAALTAGGVTTLTASGLPPGAHVVSAEYGGDANFNASNATLSGGQVIGSVVEFVQSAYNVAERAGSLTVTVRRTGDTSAAVDVDYATDDGSVPSVSMPCSDVTGIALDRCDFTRALGTLHFAAGQTEQTFKLLISDDSYDEGPETATLRLSNPSSGAALGARTAAMLNIADDSPESSGNPIDDDETFVRQHYRDFLNREADADGLKFWTDGIKSCGADAACREVKRIDTSAAFFLSIEFQETGYLVERMYKAAFGDATSPNVVGTAPLVRLNEFLTDTQRIGRDVVVNSPGWEDKLKANKQAYALEFVRRQRFMDAFPSTMSAEEFVTKLDQNAGGVLNAVEKAQLVASLAPDPSDASRRADVFRQVAENATLRQRETNRAFVLMQFFGYLRRDADAAPDKDFRGWKFWLDKLDEFGGDFRRAELVKAFITSIEYRQRFGR